jgi:hypothetical protein
MRYQTSQERDSSDPALVSTLTSPHQSTMSADSRGCHDQPLRSVLWC